MSDQWNFADVWEEVARRYPDRQALSHGERTVTWAQFDEHANSIGWNLLNAGLRHQSKVAQYQRNSPEYVEVLFGVFKAGLVPVNTNYRYGVGELKHLWVDSDTEAVVFDAEFTPQVSQLRDQLTRIRTWIRVGSVDDCPEWAVAYSEAATSHPQRVGPTTARSGDDLYLLYTGGTTGKPKGVMWRQDDLFRALERQQGATLPDPVDVSAFVDQYAASPLPVLPAAPLMHGTACWFALPVISRGGAVVTLTSRSLDPVELLDAVAYRKIKGLCIAGNAFARPILERLDRDPRRWDLSSLRVITSSGAVLSEDYKRRLLAYAPRSIVVDSLGSSESGAMGRSISSGDGAASKAAFILSPNARVIDDDGNDVDPGSGRAGRLAFAGYIPVGYYGDPEKTASTFVTIDGLRHVIPGDLAEVAADGSVHLLGRGSSCINTAGEKVYPEEVEEALKTLPGVADAGVFGVPDDRLGESVTAVVLLDPEVALDEANLIAGVKALLAGYKAPRRIYATSDFPRGPNGKLEFAALRAIAAASSDTVSASAIR